MVEAIKQAIETAVPGATVYVVDPNNDGQHFQALVISESFEGLSLVEQHQAVMNPLGDAFASNTVHALGLKTFTPAKWEKKKHNYGL